MLCYAMLLCYLIMAHLPYNTANIIPTLLLCVVSLMWKEREKKKETKNNVEVLF